MSLQTAMTEGHGEQGAQGELSTFDLDVFWAEGRAEGRAQGRGDGQAEGRDGDAAIARHVAGCARCSAYLAQLDGLQAASPPAKTGAVKASRAAGLRGAAVLAGLALAAGAALLMRTKEPAREDGYVGIKGTPAVQLLVHRGQDTRIWDGRAALHPGDALALRVACEGLAKVAVAAPGPSGWTRLSDAACPVGDAPLPFTLKVDAQPGDESLAVVLTKEAHDDAALQRAIVETTRTPEVWVVRFVMPKTPEEGR